MSCCTLRTRSAVSGCVANHACTALGWLFSSERSFWNIVTSRRTLNALRVSFGLAFAAACVNLVMGSIIVWALVRYRFPGRRLFEAIVDGPVALPTAVAGVALTALFAEKGWLGAPLAALGIDLPVGQGPRPALVATLRLVTGLVELR